MTERAVSALMRWPAALNVGCDPGRRVSYEEGRLEKRVSIPMIRNRNLGYALAQTL